MTLFFYGQNWNRSDQRVIRGPLIQNGKKKKKCAENFRRHRVNSERKNSLPLEATLIALPPRVRAAWPRASPVGSAPHNVFSGNVDQFKHLHLIGSKRK
ncbi:MAG: hypothetical protein [Cressdnaviricota sp.]|nr:MAG: hypothetical protein [Cressdnaviricota sp.]